MKYCGACERYYSGENATCPKDNASLENFEVKNLAGKTLDGKYTISNLLGVGGMGAVFRAQHAFIGNEVALKIILPEMIKDNSIVERFLREARAAATIDHPNAIRVTDFGRVGDLLYLVMEFIKGKSMSDLLKERKRLTPTETAEILKQVAAALDVAHSHGIVHRDLKPDNIMIKDRDKNTGNLTMYNVKVVDFGIAKVKSGEGESGLTQVGTIIGTANYMSPEQCQGSPVDHSSDIYSLGVIAYESLTGQVPFTAESPMQVIVKHILQAPAPPSSIVPNISSAVEQVVLRAMAKHPSQRYASAGEFARALQEAVEKGGGAPEITNAATVVGQMAPVINMAPPAQPQAQTVIGAIQAPTNAQTVVGAAPGVTGGIPKVLLVISSKAIAMLYKLQIQQAGFQVIDILDSLEASSTVLVERPNIVVVDINMPKLSGTELCTMIRTKPSMAQVANVPVLLFSSSSEEELKEKVASCQANSYIHKSWSMDRVVSELSKFKP